MRNDFAIFILTHGRPDTQLTLKTLLACGYTGRWYLVLDDQDDTIQKYIDNFGADRIIVFNKNHYINSCETIAVPPKDKCILYAKVAAEEIAKSLNLTSFVLADDDIYKFRFRYVDGNKLRSKAIRSNMDKIIGAYNDFILSAPITAISPLYTTMYISGIKMYSQEHIQHYRIPYIFVFRNSQYPVNWIADYGEDTLTAIQENKCGNCMLGLPFIQEDSTAPDKRSSGGMSETYNSDTFKLIMRCVVAEPSIVTPQFYNGKFVPRLNRSISFPKIISGGYKNEEIV